MNYSSIKLINIFDNMLDWCDSHYETL